MDSDDRLGGLAEASFWTSLSPVAFLVSLSWWDSGGRLGGLAETSFWTSLGPVAFLVSLRWWIVMTDLEA